tara:strand:- start:829 stop:1662 length:834 start_codon:yes stop_codon:yes gene_type:complete
MTIAQRSLGKGAHLASLLAATMLAACSGGVDTQNAALSNQSDNAASPVAQQDNGVSNAPDAANPAAIPGAGQGAADTLQRYYGAIASGDYATAYALWDDKGAASGMTQKQFAQSFGRFAAYRADVGEPGAVQAPQGKDRYVDVPITITGTGADGTDFRKEGQARMHSVENDDAADQTWKIAQIEFASPPTPKRGETANTAPIVRQLDCIDGSHFTATFDPISETVAISAKGKELAVLASQRPASGIYYRSGEYVMRGKGDRVAFSRPDKAPLPCQAK